MTHASPKGLWRGPLLAFGGLWAVQCALVMVLPLVADEAYYLAWSTELGLGYLDHPPGVAWWVALGGGHPRLPGLLLMPVGWALLADAARRWGLSRWRWVPALVMATPLGFSASLLATPDVPLVLAWCVVLWGVAAERVVLVGLAVGMGLWAKSAMLVAAPAVWWVLGPARGAAALLVAGLVYAPHIAWSLSHDGLPWTFQASIRRVDGVHLLEAVGGQLLVVTPGWAWLAARGWRAASSPAERALRALSLPILAAWLGLSLGTRIEANWPALAWPAALLLALAAPAHAWRRAAIGGAVMTLGAAAALPVLVAVAPPGAGPPRDGYGLRACLDEPLPLVASRYQEKALLDASGAPAPYLRAQGHRISQYDRGLGPAVPVPACDFVYLDTLEQLGERCAGQARPERRCGLDTVRCLCRAAGAP